MALAVPRLLASAQDGHKWPDEMPGSARLQVIARDGKCLYWALSAKDGKGRQEAADEVRRALTEGDMPQPPGSGWARQVMRVAGVQTWGEYLDKVRTGWIWGGACEVGRWAHQRGCRIALYREWGPRGVYQKMAEVGEGGRRAAVLLWSRREGGHSCCCSHQKRRRRRRQGGKEEREKTGVEEVEMEVELVTREEPAEDQGTRGRPR